MMPSGNAKTEFRLTIRDDLRSIILETKDRFLRRPNIQGKAVATLKRMDDIKAQKIS
jgi:hypothetical protein